MSRRISIRPLDLPRRTQRLVGHEGIDWAKMTVSTKGKPLKSCHAIRDGYTAVPEDHLMYASVVTLLDLGELTETYVTMPSFAIAAVRYPIHHGYVLVVGRLDTAWLNDIIKSRSGYVRHEIRRAARSLRTWFERRDAPEPRILAPR